MADQPRHCCLQITPPVQCLASYTNALRKSVKDGFNVPNDKKASSWFHIFVFTGAKKPTKDGFFFLESQHQIASLAEYKLLRFPYVVARRNNREIVSKVQFTFNTEGAGWVRFSLVAYE